MERAGFVFAGTAGCGRLADPSLIPMQTFAIRGLRHAP